MPLNSAIRPGYPWGAEIFFEGETFVQTATFRAQFRARRDGPVLVDTVNITPTSADEIRVNLTELETATLAESKVFFDVVRTDITTPDLLSGEFEVDVKRSITRL